MRKSNPAIGWALGLAVLALACWMRLAAPGGAPLHADESTGARIVGGVLESGTLVFDPKHFHGPLLHRLGGWVSWLAGAEGWKDLGIVPLRMLVALSGVGVVGVALLAKRSVGRGGALLGGAFLAVAPWQVQYSRMYLHEPLLLFTLAAALFALANWWRSPNAWWAVASGVFAGLAASTKETFVITAFGWVVAATIPRMLPPLPRRGLWRHGLYALAAFLAILYWFYSDFGARPAGVSDFFRTYWSYELTAGHGKSAGYYAGLVMLPEFHGRLWWWLGGSVLLAVAGSAMRFRRSRVIRFLTVSGLLQALVYSLITYKVPWLLLVPMAHFAMAAGVAVAEALASGWPMRRKLAMALAGAAVLVLQADQAARMAFRFPSDARNPLCYVPTSTGIERWTARCADWLRSAGAAGETVAVVGPHYWPLPWYLRSLPQVGYWESLPGTASRMPLVVAMPQPADAASRELAATHVALPEGVRDDTPVLVFIRHDIWAAATGCAPPAPPSASGMQSASPSLR